MGQLLDFQGSESRLLSRLLWSYWGNQLDGCDI